MASSHDTIVGQQKLEQIIKEFFAKTLHIILEARIPNKIFHNKDGGNFCTPQSSSSSDLRTRSKDKWFNLALHEFPDVIEKVELSRQNNLGQLVVDIILFQAPSVQEATPVFPRSFLSKCPSRKEHFQQPSGSTQNETYSIGRGEQIVERWVVQYESGNQCSFQNVHAKSNQSKQRSRSVGALASCKKIYKRMIPLVRSLYATVRLLPAYKVFRDLDSFGETSSFCLKHRVSSFAEPFTWAEDSKMDNFSFTPIETAYGGILLSVSYLPKLINIYSESPILRFQFITDYIGSSLADPAKRIPSLPTAKYEPACSSSSTDNGSWSYVHGASPSSPPPLPSRKKAEHSTTSQQAKLSFQTAQLPASKMERPSKMTPFAENRKECRYKFPKCSSPSHSRDKGSSQVNPMVQQVHGASVGRISGKKQNLLVSPGFQIGNTLQKALSCGRHDMRFTAKFSPHDSLQVSYDSMKLSHANNYDDSNMVYPFASEYHIPRTKSSDGKEPSAPVEKPQHIAVGVLVAMLKMAPPLHQEFFYPGSTSKASKCKDEDGDIRVSEASGSDRDVHAISKLVLFKSRTYAQALEELGSYKQLKDLLISKGRSHR